MDGFTFTITLVFGIILGLVSLVIIAGAIYAISIWYPRQINEKVAELKRNGRQGEATVVRLPPKKRPTSDALYTFVKIGLEIRVPGVETYEIDKVFTIPTSWVRSLETGQIVPVWIDPNNPLDHDKIVIHIE